MQMSRTPNLGCYRETNEGWEPNGHVVEPCQGHHWTNQREADDEHKGDNMKVCLFLCQCSLSKEGKV